MKNPKIFGIGFHKTGTSSLGAALSILGYRVAGPFGATDPDIARKALPTALTLVEQFDAFQDNPWPIIYKELDERYPSSKFILTVRSTDEWIRSVVRHFGNETTPLRQWIYGVGSPLEQEDIYIKRYKAHNEEVLDYFRDRPKDLLVLEIADGSGWETLCPFLDRDIPSCDFPHANKSSDIRNLVRRNSLYKIARAKLETKT